MDSRGVLSLRSLYFSSFYFREIGAQPGASFTHRLVPSTGNAKADCAWGQMSGTETSCPANSRPLSLSLLYLGASLSVKDNTQDPSTQHPERRDPWSPRAARRPPSLGWTPRGSPGDLQGPDAQARYRGGGSLQELLRTQRRLGEQPGTRIRRHRKLPAALGSVSGRRDLLTARHCSLDTARPLRSEAPPETSRRVSAGFVPSAPAEVTGFL